MWRAFVYNADVDADRVKRAYLEFVPLDSQFRDNVFVQVKNGPLDFQPREPFHPLFGALKTPVMTELQITQEYFGHSTHMVYLAPLWREFFDADTFTKGPGSPVSKVADGSLTGERRTGIAGSGQHRQRPQLDGPSSGAGQLVCVRPAGVEPGCRRRRDRRGLDPDDVGSATLSSCRHCVRCCSTPTRPTSTTRCRWACTT